MYISAATSIYPRIDLPAGTVIINRPWEISAFEEAWIEHYVREINEFGDDVFPDD